MLFLVPLTALQFSFISVSAALLWKDREALKASKNEFTLPEKHKGALELMKIISIIRETKNIEQSVLLLMQEIDKNFTSC